MEVGSAEPQVVIVGAGPAGLAAAIELGGRGVSCLVVERNERAGYAPRAKTTHTRTREHLRRWGIADKLAAASPFGVNYPSNVIYVTRLGGLEITRFENAFAASPVRNDLYSEHAQWIPQYKLEGVLRAHAESLPGVTIAFGTEFVAVDDTGADVEVRLRDIALDSERTINASYLIGADGARSHVREAIGAKLDGTYGLSRNYNVIFRAPGLAEAHRHGPGIMYIQINAEAPGLIGPLDAGDLWYFMPTYLPQGERLSEEETLDLIRLSTGIDLDYEVLSADEWVASSLLADHYSRGRVFLIGDACHLHPPFGGFGMNMGIADSVDLGWKMAAVLNGWGGKGLLATYEAERRSAHRFVIAEAEANHASSPNRLYRPGLDAEDHHGAAARAEVGALIQRAKGAEFHALGVVLGLRYEDSPIIVPDGSPKWIPSRDYVPTAAPGSLAPHCWLKDGRSLYDLFGPDFTLLVLGDADANDVDAARRDAIDAGIPLDVVVVNDDALVELYGATRALIRPDQHVAWRGERWSGKAILDTVVGRLPAMADAE
jgi:2-polyprenyl-6-methoxyphenol hydroxylase-like FAD-dependent oxidoreductase